MKKETPKLIAYFVAIAAVILLIAWSSSDRGGNNPPVDSSNKFSSPDLSSAGNLISEENNFDFKTISMANGKVSHRFELKNSGAEPLKIKKIYTSCMCTVASVIDAAGTTYGPFGMPGHGGLSSETISVNDGESIIVEAVFDPAAHGPQGTGKVKRIVYLETDSKTQPQTQLTFSAEVVK
ncbi:MAG: DUF1573 domain-containing protein [Patescibacteria group bacterium]